MKLRGMQPECVPDAFSLIVSDAACPDTDLASDYYLRSIKFNQFSSGILILFTFMPQIINNNTKLSKIKFQRHKL